MVRSQYIPPPSKPNEVQISAPKTQSNLLGMKAMKGGPVQYSAWHLVIASPQYVYCTIVLRPVPVVLTITKRRARTEI